MHDACPGHLGQFRGMVQQGVEQGAILMPGRRMHHQAGGLVDHQQCVVFIDDIQLDVFRLPVTLHFPLGIQFQQFAAVEDIPWPNLLAVHQQAAILDPALQPGTGMAGEQLGCHLVKALTTAFKGDGCRHADSF